MPFNWKSRARNTMFFGALIVSCCLLAGCLTIFSQPAPTPTPEPAPAPQPAPTPDPSIALREENESLRQALTDRDKALADSKAKVDALERDILSLNLKLLEAQALANELQNRAERQQHRLDAAIVDVVRSKAKLRSIESKAEAVSTLAEAEIAVNEFKDQLPALDALATEEFVVAENLLKMSSEAFKDENFGGALYLANQSKAQVRAIKARFNQLTEDIAGEGETSFSQPLPLKVLKRSNFRQGPGLSEAIIGSLDPGTLVVGHAFKNNWVYIKTQQGVAGWIYLTLIGAR